MAWPTRPEVANYTAVVLVTLVFMGVITFLFDSLTILVFAYYLSADSPRLRQTIGWLREVGKLPLLGRRSTDEPERHLAGRVPDLNVVFRTDDNGTVQGLVAAGVGIVPGSRSVPMSVVGAARTGRRSSRCCSCSRRW